MEPSSTQQSLIDLFAFPSKAIICIAGSGGKTTLMKMLAKELMSTGNRVLLSTTTKLAASEISDGFDFLVKLEGEKALAPELTILKEKSREYDFTLIEADGSAGKPLKGWRQNEPVIPDFAQFTIGVVDISCIGEPVDDARVHRKELFKRLTGNSNEIQPESIAALINHPDGLFKASANTDNMVFLSHVESPEDWEHAEQIGTDLSSKFKVIAGSLLAGKFIVLNT
jgi:hypothetical protein